MEKTETIFFSEMHSKRLRGKNKKIAARDILYKYKEMSLHHEAGQILKWAAQMGYGIFTLGDTENSAGQGTEQAHLLL